VKSPKISTIKRLFAVSGNRCAFPTCDSPLVHDGKVTGRVCHIKAARPGGKRYDRNQTSSERHGCQNLILMCPVHHDVIDDDEVEYPVGRLIKLKADHESQRGAPLEIDDRSAQQFIVLLSTATTNVTNVYNQNVSSINQSGGITAHTVNIGKPRRVMGQRMKRGILEQCPRDKKIVVWSVAGDEETHYLAQEVFEFMRTNGFSMFGEGPQGNVYLQPSRGVRLVLGDQLNELHVGHPDGSENVRP